MRPAATWSFRLRPVRARRWRSGIAIALDAAGFARSGFRRRACTHRRWSSRRRANSPCRLPARTRSGSTPKPAPAYRDLRRRHGHARAKRRAWIRGAHIVVGTPGRLRDHIDPQALDLSDAIRAVVLDEADEMLDLGFREDLEFILEATRARKSAGRCCSRPRCRASIAELASESYQRDAVRIATTAATEAACIDIEYRAIWSARRRRSRTPSSTCCAIPTSAERPGVLRTPAKPSSAC
jgi:hypothetical protein